MESVYQRERLKSNGFRNRRVASICANLNALSDRAGKVRSLGKWNTVTWPECCGANAKYFLTVQKQLVVHKENPWQQCRINAESDIEQVRYTHEEAWTRKEYQILRYWNLKFREPVERSPIWQVKAHYETSRLNYLRRDFIDGKVISLSGSWSKCQQVNCRQMHRTPDYQEVTRIFGGWDLACIASQRWMGTVTDEWGNCSLADMKRMNAI